MAKTPASKTQEVAWLTGAAKDDAFSLLVEDSSGTVSDRLLDVLRNDPGSASLYGVYQTAQVYSNASTKTPLAAASSASTTLGGSVTIANGQIAYHAPLTGTAAAAELVKLGAGQTITDSFYYVIWLGQNGAYSLAKAEVVLTGIDDAAVISGTASGDVVEDTIVTVSGTLSVIDPDNNESGFQGSTQQGSYGSFTLTAGTLGSGATPGSGEWTYALDHDLANALAAGESHQETFTVTSVGGTTSTVTITVTGTNDGPTATADTASGTENQTLVIDVLANDTDPDHGAVLSLVSVDATSGGGSASVVDGNVVFDPGTALDHLAQGATATVTIEYTMQDEHHAQSSSTVSITITGENDAASIAGTDTGSVTEDGALTATGALTVNDVDDGENSFDVVQASDLQGIYGDFTFDSASGHWTYTLRNTDANVQALASADHPTEELTVWSLDHTDSRTIVVTVNGADEPVVLNLPTTYHVNHGMDVNDRQVITGFDSNDILVYSKNLTYVGPPQTGDYNGDSAMDTLLSFSYLNPGPNNNGQGQGNTFETLEVLLVGFTGFDPATQLS